MIYPEIGELVREILERRKNIYLCTNGMFIQKKLHEFKPTSRVLLQRPPRRPARRRTTSPSSARASSTPPIDGIKAAKEAGFLVCTNTTVFKETDMAEIDAAVRLPDQARRRRLHDLAGLRLRGGARDQPDGAAEIFMTRDDIRAKFREAEELFKKYQHDVVAGLPGVPPAASAS